MDRVADDTRRPQPALVVEEIGIERELLSVVAIDPHHRAGGQLHVIESETRVNAVSGAPFVWALVDSVGGTFDTVIDPDLLPHQPRPGQVLAGWFWLSARLLTAAPRKKPGAGWLQRLVGR